MRREETQLEVSNVAWLDADGDPRQPTLTIRARGDTDALVDRLRPTDGEPLSGATIDVTFRFQDDTNDEGTRGVLAVSDRVTGEFLLETNAPVTVVMDFVAAARRYGERTDGSTHYRARIVVEDESLVDFEKRTLLVYSSDGALLRQRSLIPSGVEI